MRTATVTTNKGETWSTSINGTDESICDYFLGKQSNRGRIDWDHDKVCEIEIDDMQTVIKVEIDGKPYTLGDRVSLVPMHCGSNEYSHRHRIYHKHECCGMVALFSDGWRLSAHPDEPTYRTLKDAIRHAVNR